MLISKQTFKVKMTYPAACSVSNSGKCHWRISLLEIYLSKVYEICCIDWLLKYQERLIYIRMFIIFCYAHIGMCFSIYLRWQYHFDRYSGYKSSFSCSGTKYRYLTMKIEVTQILDTIWKLYRYWNTGNNENTS